MSGVESNWRQVAHRIAQFCLAIPEVVRLTVARFFPRRRVPVTSTLRECMSPLEFHGLLRHGQLNVQIASEDQSDLTELARLLRPGLQMGSPRGDEGVRGELLLSIRRRPDDASLIECDLDGIPLPGSTVPTIARSLLGQLALRVIEAEPQLTHLHAGVVSVDGRGVVIPAASGVGKSNLVAALARSHALLTDELVAVDRDLDLLRAASRPVCLKAASHERGASFAPTERRPPPEEPWILPAVALGGLPQSIAIPWLIVLPDRSSGDSVVEPVHAAETLEALIGQCTDITVDPPGALADLAWLAATVPAVRVHYVDAVDAVPEIVERLVSTAARPHAKHWCRVAEPVEPARFPHRAAGILSVVVDGCVVLWRPESKLVFRLNETGSVTWQSLDGTLPVPEVMVSFVDDLMHAGMVECA